LPCISCTIAVEEASVLKLAIKAQLPIIAVTTRDTLNLPDVLKEVTGCTPVRLKLDAQLVAHKVYFHIVAPSEKLPLRKLYEQLVTLESTLILVNPPQVADMMFSAGEVPVPRKLMLTLISGVLPDLKKAASVARALGGCTLKEAAEYARLTMAREGSLTPQGIAETRRSMFHGSSGLTQVDLKQGFYSPHAELAAWIAQEKSYFLECTDPRLIPRGLLFDGPPGTGKTAGAKYIAAQFGVPLYRVDIGGTKGKYVGTSEANLLTNLARIDREEPCVALLDEVEKVFSTAIHDSSGVTTTMLSQLLWWLAERRSRVLVLMTTNNVQAIPKELYRDGRADKTMWFGGLTGIQAITFIREVLKTFGLSKQLGASKILQQATPIAGTNPVMYSQAALTNATYTFVKSHQKLACSS
jgi:ATPase family associated with various cellular activities (AAA)